VVVEVSEAHDSVVDDAAGVTTAGGLCEAAGEIDDQHQQHQYQCEEQQQQHQPSTTLLCNM